MGCFRISFDNVIGTSKPAKASFIVILFKFRSFRPPCLLIENNVSTFYYGLYLSYLLIVYVMLFFLFCPLEEMHSTLYGLRDVMSYRKAR
jgi:hypothetical protein